MRLRLSVEEILLVWQQSEKTADKITIELSKRFKQINLAVKCTGQPLNPVINTEDAYGSELIGYSMLENLELSPSWVYRDGINIVTASQKISKPQNQSIQVAVAIVASVLSGYICIFCRSQLYHRL